MDLRVTVKSDSALRCQRSYWQMALFGEEEFLMQQCVTLSDLSFKNILLALLKENTLLGGDLWKKWTEAHTTCRGICS